MIHVQEVLLPKPSRSPSECRTLKANGDGRGSKEMVDLARAGS